jgi:6-phospho-beta-glucosidase
MGLKIAVIGGASSYTPELFANLVENGNRVEVDQVTLFDPNFEKVVFITEVCRKLIKESRLAIEAVAAENRQKALVGADFVIMQIRVGGLAARVRDEKLPMQLGMVGNETTGAGGFMCGLRTVTATLNIAQDIEHLAPDAWIMNLSNPAGIVTEAIYKHSNLKAVGFCNIPINTQYDLAEVLQAPPEKIQMDYFGLNHLSWVRGVTVEGREMLQPLLAATHDRRSILYRRGLVDPMIDPDWLRILGMVPRWYNRYFYYPRQTMTEDRRETRVKGEEDLLAEEKLHQIYATVGYNQDARQILGAKGGAQYYLPVLQVIEAIVHDTGEVVIADVLNGYALPDLPPHVAVEVPARFGKNGFQPLPVGPAPLCVRGLLQTVKTYEELTIQAAVTGDRGLAIAALVANPLVGTYPKARKFFEVALENERSYLPQFF